MYKTIVYIGDFDFRNQNVQSFLVKNNSKLFEAIGYSVYFVGINREQYSFNVNLLGSDNNYLELPNSLTIKGVRFCKNIVDVIIDYLERLSQSKCIKHIITYQSPTYAVAIKKVAQWCKEKNINYVVNCADLPVFSSQPFFRRIIMRLNWHLLHKYNKRYAQGVISVSRFIENFYKKDNCQYVVIPPLYDGNTNLTVQFEDCEITTFVYAGTPFVKSRRAVKTKGMKDRLDKVIDLFLSLPKEMEEYVFLVIGISKEDYLNGVPRHRQFLEHSTRIKFLGRLDHNQTLYWVSKADFSINYRDESLMTKAGFSTKIVESISLGTPVIMNDIGDVGLYLKQNSMWVKLSNSMEDNVKIISSLIAMPVRVRKQNKDICEKSHVFWIDNYVSKVEAFLRQLEGRNI